jgi:large subunit ribosomal protein L4
MKALIYNQNGKKLEENISLPNEIFDVKMNSDLVHQVAISQMANRRRVIAKTKDRSEVRGGGRKPWRQKGTGRARHGSIRSPIWRHGGVTFGPTTDIVFKKDVSKKMRRKALFMVLTAKAKKEFLIVLDNLKLEKPKTKLMNEILKKLPGKDSSRLVILPQKDDAVIKATRNISRTKIELAQNLNVLDLLSFKYLILPKNSIKVIKETFSKKE